MATGNQQLWNPIVARGRQHGRVSNAREISRVLSFSNRKISKFT